MIPQDQLAQLPVEVVSTSFDLLQIALGIAILVVVVFIHGAGIRRVSRYFSERWVHVTTETPHWRVNLLFGSVIAQLVIVHLIEVMVWALPIYWLNLIPELSAAAFFAAETYTTLGEGCCPAAAELAAIGADHRRLGAFHLRLDIERARLCHDSVRNARYPPCRA